LIAILGFAINKFGKPIVMFFFILLLIDNSFNSKEIIRESKADLIKRKEDLIFAIKNSNSDDKKIVALIDTVTPAYISHIDMMLATQSLGLKTINGYSSYCPDAYGKFFNNCSESGLHKWLQDQNIDSKKILIIRAYK
jgi:hypothetical protein